MLSQIIAVTGVNIRSIPARFGSSTVAVIGIAGVVLVFVAVLSIAEGVAATMKASGDPGLVLILRAGSDTEMTSGLAGDAVRVIQDAPGIARDTSGAPMTSPELFVVVDHPLKRSGSPANVPLRGVSPEAFQVHNKLKIVEGRNLEFGKNEIIAGQAAARQFVNLNVGTKLTWGENSWTVVGIFDEGGAVSESELWCDVKVLQPAYRRGNSYQSVYARLSSPDSFQQLKDSLTSNPQLTVAAMRAADYYGSQTGNAAGDHPNHWRDHRRADGGWSHIRRCHNDVHRRGKSDTGNRYPQGTRVRQCAGCRFGYSWKPSCWALWAELSAGRSRGSHSTGSKPRR